MAAMRAESSVDDAAIAKNRACRAKAWGWKKKKKDARNDPRDLGGRAKLDTPGPQWQSGGKGPFRRVASLAFAPSVRVQP